MEGSFIPESDPPVRSVSFRKITVALFILVILGAGIYLGYLYATSSLQKDFNLEVTKSDNIHTISKKLLDDGVIKNRFIIYISYYIFGRHTPIEPGVYQLLRKMGNRDVVYALESRPASKEVYIPAKASKENIAAILSDALGWGALDRQFFSHTYAGMQWQQYQNYIETYFQKKYSWNDNKTHVFLTLSALYYEGQYDFLKNMYIPGTYEIPVNASRAQVAGILIDRFLDEYPDNTVALERFIDRASADNIANLINDQMVLMPDIVSVPPEDVTLKKEGGRTYLLFSAAYWNKGRGPLEFVADPKTRNVEGDVERNVFQRIYSLDGDYTERLSGKFLWHSPHRHYHFVDFALYTLESIKADGTTEAELRSQKTTFCIRDTEPIDLAHPGATKSPSYSVCGKERQGISPGWADSYYYTYVDQRFDVTSLPAGQYKLKIVINPLDRFEEITKDNNVGEAIIDLDVQNNKVKVISERNHGFND